MSETRPPPVSPQRQIPSKNPKSMKLGGRPVTGRPG